MAAAVPTKNPGTDFQALDACHQQISAHLDRLDALFGHLSDHGVDAHAQQEAGRIETFFSETSQQHHVDEESKVFPALLNSSDPSLVATVRMLQQDHGWIEEDWLAIAPQLRAIAAGYSWYDPDELRHAIGVFVELCREHIQLEESIIYPQAKAIVAKLARRRASLPPLRFTTAGPSSS
ncbi:hemerythrin domain-containing protein [uncultured Piscinibacter sp.]|uniref:hemerythrin domain-containing protein n=1 Tax=uncultured Piscinibacter sp. TaxID=1131835 RepID=UPI0026261C40|nr:hemerythrin domain-containing protein [uncultured Piscinibacter sp.]